MSFFHYNQNNSGGRFDYDPQKGITHHVIIEAATPDLAALREKAEKAAVDFAQNRTSAAPLVRSIRMAMRHGCGDHSCEFVKPTGMGTNGGCRCWSHLDSAFYAVQRSLLSDLARLQEENEKLKAALTTGGPS